MIDFTKRVGGREEIAEQDFGVKKWVAEEGGGGGGCKQDLVCREIIFSEEITLEEKDSLKEEDALEEDRLPEKVEEIIREGKKEVDEQNHRLKIADDFRLPFFGDSIKEDLARDDKEEKKQKKRKLSELRRRLSEVEFFIGQFGIPGDFGKFLKENWRVFWAFCGHFWIFGQDISALSINTNQKFEQLA